MKDLFCFVFGNFIVFVVLSLILIVLSVSLFDDRCVRIRTIVQGTVSLVCFIVTLGLGYIVMSPVEVIGEETFKMMEQDGMLYYQDEEGLKPIYQLDRANVIYVDSGELKVIARRYAFSNFPLKELSQMKYEVHLPIE